MIQERVREWLMDHPEVLSLAFVSMVYAVELDPDGTGGTSAYIGP